MKKTLTIFLLLIFAYNAGGYLLIFKIQQSRIRKEIKQQLKTGVSDVDLKLIILNDQTENQIEWKDENEFSLHGILYDIVKRTKDENGVSMFYCITDDQETALFAGLNDQVNKNTDARKNEKNALTNFFKLQSTLSSIPEYKANLSALEQKNYALISYFYSAPAIDILSPPPKNL